MEPARYDYIVALTLERMENKIDPAREGI